MMSQEFKKLIEQLQDDPKIISKFLADPVAFLEKLHITSEERKALLSRDVEALNVLGLNDSQAVGALSGAHSQICSTNRRM